MDTDEELKRALLQSRQMEFIGMTQINSVARLRQLVRSYYKASNSGTDKEYEFKGRANGFIEALLMTTRITKKQIEEVIEKEHLDFFGMTREARSKSTDKTNGRFVERDWEKFDEPAYMRRPLRCRKKTATSDLEASRSLKNH